MTSPVLVSLFFSVYCVSVPLSSLGTPPVVVGVLQEVGGEEAERQHGALQVRVLVLLRVADAAHHQLLDVLPAEVRALLMDQRDAHAALDTLMQHEGTPGGHVSRVVHHHRHVSVVKKI